MRTRPTHPCAFTLLELVFVLVVICTALAVAAPSLRGWSKGQRLRDAGDQFLAVARYGRTQAIADGQTYRLIVTAQAGQYQLMKLDGQQFVNLGSEWGRPFIVPEGHAIKLVAADQQRPQAGDRMSTGLTAGAAPAAAGEPIGFVEFSPTGRTYPPAAATITGESGETFDIICPSPAEGFVMATSGGVSP